MAKSFFWFWPYVWRLFVIIEPIYLAKDTFLPRTSLTNSEQIWDLYHNLIILVCRSDLLLSPHKSISANHLIYECLCLELVVKYGRVHWNFSHFCLLTVKLISPMLLSLPKLLFNLAPTDQGYPFPVFLMIKYMYLTVVCCQWFPNFNTVYLEYFLFSRMEIWMQHWSTSNSYTIHLNFIDKNSSRSR